MPAEPQPGPLKKIRDLLRLAQSSNPFEADLAKRRAEELLRKHNLTAADTIEQAVEVAVLPEGLDGNQRVELARQIAKSRGCQTSVRRDGIAFRGYPEAAKDAKELFTALTRIAERYCEPYGPYHTDNDRFAWRTCFWLGFVAAIQAKLDPEHGRIPDAALATIVSRGSAPAFVERVSQALLQEHHPAEADQLRQRAYAAGVNIANQLSDVRYRNRR